MNDTVLIIKSPSGNSTLSTGDSMAGEMDILKKKRAYVSFGTQKCFVDIEISGKINGREIYLSKNIIDELHLPDYPVYELRARGNEIAIGPCIGIMACQKEKDMTRRRLKELSLNILDYPGIHGAVIAFSLEKVDTLKRLVEGYCYNPGTDNWEKGIFPYPLAIYRRTGMSDEMQNHFLSAIGDTVFNNYNFSKYQMYEWFSNEAEIVPHLPYTKIFESGHDIFDMLEKYERVYIKPIWGMKGFGVVRAGVEDGKVVFRYRENDENKVVSVDMNNRREAEHVTGALFKLGRHIIQQGLKLVTHDGGVIDFRCVMQKNDSSNWVCNGIVSRIGAKESVVSNISSGGMAIPAAELFRNALSLSEVEVFKMKESMIGLCVKVCRTLDSYGINSGTLGLDLGVDTDGKVWIIEVNNRSPHPAIVLRVNDLQGYYTILASPLYYAKSLAGFGS